MNSDKDVVVLAAGGTGGHVFPAVALASELNERGYNVVFVTDIRCGEYVKKYDGLDVRIIASSTVGGGFIRKVKAALSITKGYIQARKIVKKMQPVVAVGFGGYPSFPTVLAAQHKHVPVVLHEQNSLLGKVNFVLSDRARYIATSFDDVTGVTEQNLTKVINTGNPVRQEIKALRDTAYPAIEENGKIHILITGGSQGAHIFSDVVPQAIALLPTELKKRVVITQQCVESDVEKVSSVYKENSISNCLSSFFNNMPKRLMDANLLIARSGASTLAELAVVGRPAILVPLPTAKDDHQTVNANAFEDAGAGWVIPQSTFTPEMLAGRIESFLLRPALLNEAALQAHALGKCDADKKLADIVCNLAVEKK